MDAAERVRDDCVRARQEVAELRAAAARDLTIRLALAARPIGQAESQATGARAKLVEILRESSTRPVGKMTSDVARILLEWRLTGMAAPGFVCPLEDALEARSSDGKIVGGSLLHFASHFGNPWTVAVVVDVLGVDVNDTDLLGRTPLHAAVDNGQLLAARALLCRGADPTAADVAGQTAVATARLKTMHGARAPRGWAFKDLYVELQDAANAWQAGTRPAVAGMTPDADAVAELLAAAEAGPGGAAGPVDEPETPVTPRRGGDGGPAAPVTPAGTWRSPGSALRAVRTPARPLEAAPASLALACPAAATRFRHLLAVRGAVLDPARRRQFDKRVALLASEAEAAAAACTAGSASPGGVGPGVDAAFGMAFGAVAGRHSALFDVPTRDSPAFRDAMRAAAAALPPFDRGAWAEGVRAMACAVGAPGRSPNRTAATFVVLLLDAAPHFPAHGPAGASERLPPKVKTVRVELPSGTGSGIGKDALAVIARQALPARVERELGAVVGPVSLVQSRAVVREWRSSIRAAMAGPGRGGGEAGAEAGEGVACAAGLDAAAAACEAAAPGPDGDDAVSAALEPVLPQGSPPGLGRDDVIREAASLARRSPASLACPHAARTGQCDVCAVMLGLRAALSLGMEGGRRRFAAVRPELKAGRAAVLWAEASAVVAARAMADGRAAAGGAASLGADDGEPATGPGTAVADDEERARLDGAVLGFRVSFAQLPAASPGHASAPGRAGARLGTPFPGARTHPRTHREEEEDEEEEGAAAASGAGGRTDASGLVARPASGARPGEQGGRARTRLGTPFPAAASQAARGEDDDEDDASGVSMSRELFSDRKSAAELASDDEAGSPVAARGVLSGGASDHGPGDAAAAFEGAGAAPSGSEVAMASMFGDSSASGWDVAEEEATPAAAEAAPGASSDEGVKAALEGWLGASSGGGWGSESLGEAEEEAEEEPAGGGGDAAAEPAEAPDDAAGPAGSDDDEDAHAEVSMASMFGGNDDAAGWDAAESQPAPLPVSSPVSSPGGGAVAASELFTPPGATTAGREGVPGAFAAEPGPFVPAGAIPLRPEEVMGGDDWDDEDWADS